jgi:hypothetical protein
MNLSTELSNNLGRFSKCRLKDKCLHLKKCRLKEEREKERQLRLLERQQKRNLRYV